jgi:hypothetical protein
MSKLMARICFPEGDAELGIEALLEAGYSLASKVFEQEPEHVFVEATAGAEVRDSRAMLDEINELVEPFGGFVADVGPVPTGHVPFEYEAAAWRS